MMQVLLISTLIITAFLILLGGKVARRRGLPEQTGISIALLVVTISALLAPSHLREQLLVGESGERVLAIAREIGLTGLFFLAGMRLRRNALRPVSTVSITVATSGLGLFGLIMIVIVAVTGADWSPAILVAAAFAVPSVCFSSHFSSESDDKNSEVAAAGLVSALFLGGALLLVIHLLGAFHEVAGRASSISAYTIVAAYEIVKIALFFGFAWFVATRFVDRAAKARARLSDVRAAIGYLLIAVLLFVLARTALGELGALVWSFLVGVLFTRSEAGKRVEAQRPAAAAMFLSFAFLPMFLEPHGRTVPRLPLLLGIIASALIARFASSATAARLAGYAGCDASLIALSTIGSGELAIALLAFGITRWAIDGPQYFAVLFFALVSMLASALGWKAAIGDEKHQPERPNSATATKTLKAQRSTPHKKVGFAIVIAATSLFALQSAARAQTPSVKTEDDPVARAMRTIEESVNHRATAAEQVLQGSKLIDESKAARQQGKRDLAREAVKKAEDIAAEGEFNRSALIDELLRLVAAERAALDSPAHRNIEQLPAAGNLRFSVPSSVSSRLEQYRDSFTRILQEEQVPIGLLAVALVESGFNPLALSPKGARGIWQFMPATAVHYGLTVQRGNDHRTHPEHSTRAAARYLRFLYNQFGDWKLALAAYNAGEQRVQRVIEKTGIRDFGEMSRRGLLPFETRRYVPAVLAASSRIGGANSLTKTKERQKRQTRAGVVEAIVKLDTSTPPPESFEKP